MATKPAVLTIPDDTEEDIELPPALNENGLAQATGMSLDDLNGSIDDTELDRDTARLNPPVGDWIKDSAWEFDKRVNQEDQQPGDLDSNGRTFFNIKGKPLPRTANQTEYEPTLFFRLSPDKRFKQDDPGKFDSAYRLFLRARELYISINGEKPRTYKALVECLVSDDYTVRTMNGDNGALVVDIKGKREKR